MIEVAIHNGSPGLANRIKNYASILRTFKQALTIKNADAYIFDDIRVATDEELNTFPCYDNWRLATLPGEDKYKTEYKHIDLLYDRLQNILLRNTRRYSSILKSTKIF